MTNNEPGRGSKNFYILWFQPFFYFFSFFGYQILNTQLIPTNLTLITSGINALNPSTYPTKVAMFEGQPLPVKYCNGTGTLDFYLGDYISP